MLYLISRILKILGIDLITISLFLLLLRIILFEFIFYMMFYSGIFWLFIGNFLGIIKRSKKQASMLWESMVINRELVDFGKSMYIIAICIILSLIPFVIFITGIIISVFIIKFLVNINRINSKLNNRNLWGFSRNYIRFINGSFIGVVMISIFIIYTGILTEYSSWSPFYLRFTLVFIYIIFCFFFTIVGVFHIKAWRHLYIFFEENKKKFPEQIASDAVKGSIHMKDAASCFALAFLIIPIFIGFILYIIGLFKLSHLKKLEGENNIWSKKPIWIM